MSSPHALDRALGDTVAVPTAYRSAMRIEVVSVHPRGLPPKEAAKAWYMRVHQKRKWSDIRKVVKTAEGHAPNSDHAVENAVKRMKVAGTAGVALSNYANSGRRYGKDGSKYKMTKQQEKQVVGFVKKWRHKTFCTCAYLKRELKLHVTNRTIARSLNRRGYFWRAVSKKSPLTAEQLRKRQIFVDKHVLHPPSWWAQNMHLVFDGVTLTKAPQALTGRQKHAAQSIGHMWMRDKDKTDPKLHTYNRYGSQLGAKVPLWGGFSGAGTFPLKLWTPSPKMTKVEWAKHVPTLRKAVDQGQEVGQGKMWHDNEKFLQIPKEYKAQRLVSVLFPPNSGDLNPIETVWARLRRDLAKREFQDLKTNKNISVVQFRQRAGQLLHSYGQGSAGERYSYLQKLARGMPQRLAKCKANKYGRCGK